MRKEKEEQPFPDFQHEKKADKDERIQKEETQKKEDQGSADKEEGKEKKNI